METGNADTTLQAELIRARVLRQRGPESRALMGLSLSDFAHRRALSALKRANPGMSDVEVRIRFCALQYGEHVARALRERLDPQSK